MYTPMKSILHQFLRKSLRNNSFTAIINALTCGMCVNRYSCVVPDEDVSLGISSEVWAQNIQALKLELLGPFLFGQNTLSSQVSG